MSRRTERIFKLEKQVRETARQMIGKEMGEAFILRKEIEDLKAEIDELKKGLPK